MHAEKIRTANLPSFRLETRDAMILMSFIGILGFVLGLVVGVHSLHPPPLHPTNSPTTITSAKVLLVPFASATDAALGASDRRGFSVSDNRRRDQDMALGSNPRGGPYWQGLQHRERCLH